MAIFEISVDARPGGAVIPLCNAEVIEATEVVFLVEIYANRGGNALPGGIGDVLAQANLMFQILLLNVGDSFDTPFAQGGEILVTRTA